MHTTPHRKSRLRVLTSVVIALAVFVLPMTAVTATAAAAEPPSAGPKSSLYLTIVPETPTEELPVTIVTLECNPAGGTHPAARAACDVLDDVDGYIENIVPIREDCDSTWAPVTILATGNWGDRDVRYTNEHYNADCAAVYTNGVYAFLSQSAMTLTITPDEPSEANPVATVSLYCDPAGGTHTTAADACATLTAADGEFEKIEPSGDGCPEYWAPVTITATGTWYGRNLYFEKEHPNRTCAAVDTNYVFRF